MLLSLSTMLVLWCSRETDLVTVKFRLIVFRPFKGEIMLGKISSATEHGIKGEHSVYSMYMSKCDADTP